MFLGPAHMISVTPFPAPFPARDLFMRWTIFFGGLGGRISLSSKAVGLAQFKEESFMIIYAVCTFVYKWMMGYGMFAESSEYSDLRSLFLVGFYAGACSVPSSSDKFPINVNRLMSRRRMDRQNSILNLVCTNYSNIQHTVLT